MFDASCEASAFCDGVITYLGESYSLFVSLCVRACEIWKPHNKSVYARCGQLRQ